MDKDIKTICLDVEVEKAKEMMEKYDFSALPVIFGDPLIGIVSNKHFKQLTIDVQT